MERSPQLLSQRERLGFLLKDSVLYGTASAVSRAFSLVTFPLLARHFSLVEYGVLDFYWVLTSVLMILLVFGQDSAVARYFYEYGDRCVRRQLISQSLAFQGVVVAMLLPLLWANAERLVGPLIERSDSTQLFRIVLSQLPFLVLINFSQNLLKWTFSRTQFLAMSIGYTVVQASLMVVGVLVFDLGISGVLRVSMTTSAGFGALGLWFIRDWLAVPHNFQHLREMLPFAVPVGVICVAGAFSPSLERILVLRQLGAEELGLYAVGAKIAMLTGLVVSAFQTAWGPFSLSLFRQADAALTYNRVLKVFALGICLYVLALTLVAQPVIHLLASDRYAGAATVVFPLAMGLAIQATGWITEVGISLSKRTYLNLYSCGLGLAVTFVGILVLAPHFGLLGVGLGVVLGHTVKVIASAWLAQLAFPLPWKYGPVVLVMGLTVSIGLTANWLGVYWGSQARTISLVLGLLTVLGVGWGVLLDPSDRRGLVLMIRSRLRARHSLIPSPEE